MRLYVSGPMTGIPEWNFPAFNAAAEQLRAYGYDVVNPADGGADEATTWAEYLKEDLRLLLACDGVATLPGWTGSRGACLEVHVARALGMPVRARHEWPLRAGAPGEDEVA